MAKGSYLALMKPEVRLLVEQWHGDFTKEERRNELKEVKEGEIHPLWLTLDILICRILF